MSADQNRVSPESPTTCTVSGQVMHWDGRQWTHPSGEGCELRTHLSGDPVTAPDMVELAAAAMWTRRYPDDPWEGIDPEDCDREEYLDDARAVLDALAEAGYGKPRIITTVEELDALPIGSMVASVEAVGLPSGHVYPISYQRLYTGDWHRGGRRRDTHPENILPATVLWEPRS